MSTESVPVLSGRSSAGSVGNQPYGPGQSLRRQTWVPSHVKGPQGAPLLSTEKVNVWRR